MWLAWVNAAPLTWPVIRDLVSEIALVSEDEIISATRLLWERMKIVRVSSTSIAARQSIHTLKVASAHSDDAVMLRLWSRAARWQWRSC